MTKLKQNSNANEKIVTFENLETKLKQNSNVKIENNVSIKYRI